MKGYVSPLAAWMSGVRRSALARLSQEEYRGLPPSQEGDGLPEIEDLRSLFLIERREMNSAMREGRVFQYRLTTAGAAMKDAMTRWAPPHMSNVDASENISASMIAAGARALAAQRMRRRAFVDGAFDPNKMRRAARAEALLDDPSLLDNLLAADHGYVEDAAGAILDAFKEGLRCG